MCFITQIIYFLIAIQFTIGQVGESCLSEDKKRSGVCLKVIDCEVALRSIVSIGTHNLSKCGFEDSYEVLCCEGQQNSVHRTRIADTECKKIVNKFSTSNVIRVINGEIADPGEFPHMVALFSRKGPKSNYFTCGGVLIAEQYIITAAHCVNLRLKPIFARVGVLNISDTKMNPKSDYLIDNIDIHPNYSQPRQYHDLAIIKLKTPVVTSYLGHPVCLYTSEKYPTVMVDVTGWGNINFTHTSDVLLKAKQTIIPWYQCNRSFIKTRKIPDGIIDGQVCASDSTGTTDTCQGDSGGPLQGYTDSDGFYRLIGITSFGIGCAGPTPGVYTRVYKYLDWIESIVWPSH